MGFVGEIECQLRASNFRLGSGMSGLAEEIMEASILDLRRKMADILRALDRNETVKITYRGRRRAVLIPAGPSAEQQKRSLTAHCAFGMWKDRRDMTDVTAYVRRLRQNRAV